MTRLVMMVLVAGFLLTGCAALQTAQVLPVVVKAEDLVGRSCERIGIVQVSRERLGVDVLHADDYAWAQRTLQEEALRIGADAITAPELRATAQSFLFFPIAELKARATAIRFH
jgi:hypothetical protein